MRVTIRVTFAFFGKGFELMALTELQLKHLKPKNSVYRVEPTVKALVDAFSEHSANVQSQIKYRWSDVDGEIDLIALIDGQLFIMECKSSIVPCNVFEVRTSYDYILNGATQLDKFQKFWEDVAFREYMAAKLNWPTLDNHGGWSASK